MRGVATAREPSCGIDLVGSSTSSRSCPARSPPRHGCGRDRAHNRTCTDRTRPPPMVLLFLFNPIVTSRAGWSSPARWTTPQEVGVAPTQLASFSGPRPSSTGHCKDREGTGAQLAPRELPTRRLDRCRASSPWSTGPRCRPWPAVGHLARGRTGRPPGRQAAHPFRAAHGRGGRHRLTKATDSE